MDTDSRNEDLDIENETIPEEPELEDIEEAEEKKLKQLREKLRACDEEKRSILEESQRAKADFLNARKRLEEQLERERERIAEQHVSELLPLLDSFDAALGDPTWQDADSKWRTGVEAIFAQLKRITETHSLEEVSGAGTPFDPELHEAVAHHEGNDIVSEVLQKGYKMNGRIVRHAKVVVGKKE